MNLTSPRRRGWPLVALLAVVVAFASGFTAVEANLLGLADRLNVAARISAIVDPPPDPPNLPKVVVIPETSSTPTPTPRPPSATPEGFPIAATPSPTPLAREPVDVTIVDDHEDVFASQLTDKDCAVAATQMVLAILTLGDTSDAFQQEIKDRIGEWESWEDSHNGGWGPAAVALALADYGASGYEIRAFESYPDALRASAIAITELDKPVVMFPWWGAHTWVMTGYRADADPTLFDDARISGAHILDPWYPRVSSIWGASDPPGNFEDLGELERNWPAHEGPPGYESIGPGWTRPEGVYPDRDGRFIVLLPTTPRD